MEEGPHGIAIGERNRTLGPIMTMRWRHFAVSGKLEKIDNRHCGWARHAYPEAHQ
jgi:hypothetical protein